MSGLFAAGLRPHPLRSVVLASALVGAVGVVMTAVGLPQAVAGDISPAQNMLPSPTASSVASPAGVEAPAGTRTTFLGAEGLALIGTALRQQGTVTAPATAEVPRQLLTRASLVSGLGAFAREIERAIRPDTSGTAAVTGGGVSTIELTRTIADARRDAGEARQLTAEVRQRAEELSRRFSGGAPVRAVATGESPARPTWQATTTAVSATAVTAAARAPAPVASEVAPDASPAIREAATVTRPDGLMALGQRVQVSKESGLADSNLEGPAQGGGVEVILPGGAVAPAVPAVPVPVVETAAVPADPSATAAASDADAATGSPESGPRVVPREVPVPHRRAPARARLGDVPAAARPTTPEGRKVPQVGRAASGRRLQPTAKQSVARRSKSAAIASGRTGERPADQTARQAVAAVPAPPAEVPGKPWITPFKIPTELGAMGWE